MRVNFGAIVVAGIGKLGGQVFSRSNAGTLLKRKVSPVNKKSQLQLNVRSNLSVISSTWRSLSESQRLLWNAYANEAAGTNSFGKKFYLSGFSQFCKINANKLSAGSQLILIPPSPSKPLGIECLAPWLSVINSSFLLNLLVRVPSTHVLKIDASRNVSAGTYSYRRHYRPIATIKSTDATPISLSVNYLTAFERLGFVNDKIFIRLKTYELATGCTSQPIDLNAQIVNDNVANVGLAWSDLGQQNTSAYIASLAIIGEGIVLAGCDPVGYILRSTDLGVTWKNIGQLPNASSIRSIAYASTGIILAGSAVLGYLHRSTDNGLTWTDLGRQVGQTIVSALIYLESGVCLSGTFPNAHILRSTDFGLTWIDLGAGFGSKAIQCFCNCGNGIVLAGTSTTGKLYRSTDFGLTWSDLGQIAGETFIYAFAYLGNGIVVMGTALHGKILRSTDYGLTWSDLGQQGSNTHVCALANCGNGIVIAGTYPGGHILRSTDFGLTWSDLGSMYGQSTIFSLCFVNKSIVLAGTGANGHILRSCI